MTRALNKSNLIFGLVALLGIAQFLVCVFLAMDAYPDGYSVTENFLSDLGCTATGRRHDNSASASIFNGSIMVLGGLLIPFFTRMPNVLTRSEWMIRSSGVFSAIGLIGIGLTPCDQYFAWHHVALGFWVAPLLVMVVRFATSADVDRTTSLALYFCTSLVLLAACAYAFAGDHRGHVIFQKVLAFFAVCWFLLVFAIVSLATIQSIPSSRAIAEQQARQYLKVLRRGHRRRNVGAGHRRGGAE